MPGAATLDDLGGAFASGLRDEVSAFYLSGEPELILNLSRVMPLAIASGKPTVGPYPEMARAGLLMSYSSDVSDGFRKAGIYDRSAGHVRSRRGSGRHCRTDRGVPTGLMRRLQSQHRTDYKNRCPLLRETLMFDPV